MSTEESLKKVPSQDEFISAAEVAVDADLESSIDERKLLRKIDLHVVPWLALLYLLNFLDRGSIGNARVNVISYASSSTDILCP